MGEALDPRYVRMARSIAGAIHRRVPRNVERADLEQAALMGLVSALRKHPHSSGDGFEWYLRVRLRGAVLDELRAQDYLPRRSSQGGVPLRLIRFEDMASAYGPAIEQTPGEGESPEEIAIRQLDAAKAWGAPMCPTDARIARAVLARGRRQIDVAQSEGVSEPRVSQRAARALVAMRAHLTGTDPDGYVTERTRLALVRARYR